MLVHTHEAYLCVLAELLANTVDSEGSSSPVLSLFNSHTLSGPPNPNLEQKRGPPARQHAYGAWHWQPYMLILAQCLNSRVYAICLYYETVYIMGHPYQQIWKLPITGSLSHGIYHLLNCIHYLVFNVDLWIFCVEMRISTFDQIANYLTKNTTFWHI